MFKPHVTLMGTRHFSNSKKERDPWNIFISHFIGFSFSCSCTLHLNVRVSNIFLFLTITKKLCEDKKAPGEGTKKKQFSAELQFSMNFKTHFESPLKITILYES